MGIFETRWFDSRWKFPLHIVQLVLVVIAIGLSVPRIFMKHQPRTRANTIAVGMGSKSINIILYQLLTEHVPRFKKWASLKAYAILNTLEIVFWAAVVFLVIQANIKICVGVGCTLSWVVVVVSIFMTVCCCYAAVITNLDFRYFRKYGYSRGSSALQSSSGPNLGNQPDGSDKSASVV